MSADNGYVIRKNSTGEYVLQMYYASDDDFPDIDRPSALHFGSLSAALAKYGQIEDQTYPSEYGVIVHPLELWDDVNLYPNHQVTPDPIERGQNDRN